MSDFQFHAELFDHRALAIEKLAQHDYHWLEHFSCVDLLHDEFGLEVCGIAVRQNADRILTILEKLFPDWLYADIHYRDYERDRGWKVIICRSPERGNRFAMN